MSDNQVEIKAQSSALAHMQEEVPQALEALKQLANFALQPTALDTKTKALLTLTLAIHCQQLDCIVYHVKNAIVQQVTLAEMKELVIISAYMGGGPGMMIAEKALSVFEQLTNDSNK